MKLEPRSEANNRKYYDWCSYSQRLKCVDLSVSIAGSDSDETSHCQGGCTLYFSGNVNAVDVHEQYLGEMLTRVAQMIASSPSHTDEPSHPNPDHQSKGPHSCPTLTSGRQ